MVSALAGTLRGTLRRAWADSTQRGKRALVRLAIVPPPFRISIDITDRCNLRCPTCSKWHHPPSREELSLDQWRLVLDRIHGMPLLGEIAISGGEPFMRPDLLQIIELAKDRGFRTHVISNGWFVHGDLLRQIEESRLDILMISMNSLTESVHDDSRGKTGSHERIMGLLEDWRARKRMTKLLLSTVVTERNCGELASLARFVADKGLSGIMYQVLLPTEVHYCFAAEPCMPETTANWCEDSPLWVRTLPRLAQQIGELLELQAAGLPILNPASQLERFVTYYEKPGLASSEPCLGTHFRLHIDPIGAMRLCYGFPPIGNILQDDPRQAWKGEKAREIRKASGDCGRPCRMLNCNL